MRNIAKKERHRCLSLHHCFENEALTISSGIVLLFQKIFGSTWIFYPIGVPAAIRDAVAQGFLLGLKWLQIKCLFLIRSWSKGGWAVS